MKTSATITLLLSLVVSISISAQSLLDKGKALYESKKYAEAKKVLEDVDDDDKDYAKAQYYLGRISFDKLEYDDAADYFEEATEANPTEADYFIRLGDSYAAVAKDANMITQGMLAVKVKNAWEKVIELDARNVDARVSLVGFYSQAPGVMGGSMSRAKEMATQVTKLNPAEGHWQMGSILALEKNSAEAEKEFSKMLKADPLYVRNLGPFYADKKEYNKAFELFDQALKNNPDDYTTIYRYGKTSALSGMNLDKGEECLKKYLTHTPAYDEPSLGGAHMRLAQIKEKKGNKADARRHFEQAVKLDDSLKEAKEGLERTSK